MTAQRQKINQIIGIKDHEIVILEELFEYENGFKGATGVSMATIHQDYIDDMNDIDILKEEYEYLWRDAVQAGATTDGLEDYLEQCINEANSLGLLFVGDDDSFRAKTEDLIHELPDDQKAKLDNEFGEQGRDYETWSCSSCGRMFDKAFELDIVFRPDLVELIKQYEKEN